MEVAKRISSNLQFFLRFCIDKVLYSQRRNEEKKFCCVQIFRVVFLPKIYILCNFDGVKISIWCK